MRRFWRKVKCWFGKHEATVSAVRGADGEYTRTMQYCCPSMIPYAEYAHAYSRNMTQ